jgi:hypothetical protein
LQLNVVIDILLKRQNAWENVGSHGNHADTLVN